ncbi:MAG: thiamine phosphate synthase [Desulfomonilaceae bacterium]|nr:thiamine phosphate synthase [Desulfomonilaceae bacterium]
MTPEERLERIGKIDIYPVTCEELSEGRLNVQVLDAVLAGGAKIVQLREKHWAKRALYEVALVFRERTRREDALLIINDHVDVALAAGADGVHLGQGDLPVNAARRIAPGLIIGASTHNLEEAVRAEQDGADYVNIGPIFPTATKENAERFLGLQAIQEIGPRLNIPFTVMGGINPGNIRQVRDAGAHRVAMITGITRAPDICSRVREMRSILSERTDAT